MNVTEHPKLHRDWVHPHALHIVESLQSKGFITYLVGGCVRDLLVGIPPKDFDIATMAKPNQVKRIVPNSYVIGRRFRLVLAKLNDEQFEVATFRRSPTTEELADESLEGDNLFGTPEQDAKRRDFTFNALFYDPIGDQLIDHTGGVPDIEARMIRMIGEPEARLIEDPIRILRALRLAHKLGFTIDPELRKAMEAQSGELLRSVLPRRREEILKIMKLYDPSLTLHEAYDLGILKSIFPTLHKVYSNHDTSEEFDSYIHRMKTPFPSGEAPVDLFGILILAYVRSHIEPDPQISVNQKSLLENPELKRFMRDELGMFNVEQNIVTGALQLQHSLLALEEFEKRGRRRRNGFLSHESLPLALQFARADYLLAPQKFKIWQEMYFDYLKQESLGPTSSDEQEA